MNFLVNESIAQDKPTSSQVQNGAAAPSPFASLVPFVLIFVVFYFLMIRPQKKKMQEEQNMLNNLKKGDEVYTKSGILGKITGLTDKVATIEVSEGVSMKVLRSQIAGFSQKLFEVENKAVAAKA